MKVILKEEIEKLGKMGDMVVVKNGYARNFLIPRGLAAEASTKNLRALEHEKRVIQERARKRRKSAEAFSGTLSALTVTIKAKAGEEEKLFGSITTMDIADAVKAAGHEVDRKKIALQEPIRRLGQYTVEVKLGHDVTASLNVEVVPE
jgi:large subunit ribosomal protein L9